MNKDRESLFTYFFKIPKENAAFLYFILESTEGLVFYSTLQKKDPHEQFRIVKVSGPIEFKNLFDPILKTLQKNLSISLSQM